MVHGLKDFSYGVAILASEPTINVNVTGSTTINVNIVESVPLNVNITNTTLNVNITNTTLNVNVTNTTLNISTSSGVNIIIDKLTQDAFYERRSTLSNNGTTAILVGSNYTNRRGKFFTRGCRGFINTIDVYCDNTDTASHNLTIKVSPFPGLGPVLTFTLTIPASASADWRSVTVRRMWNYDSMFIWVQSDSDTYGRIGYDSGTPYDYCYSTDEITWIPDAYRLWIRAIMTGQTIGDVPVSGTINIIEVPVSSIGAASGSISVPAGGYADLLRIKEAGENLHIQCIAYDYGMNFFIYCDGEPLKFGGLNYVAPSYLKQWGYTNNTDGIQLLVYNTVSGNMNFFTIIFPFKWKRELYIRVYNPATTAMTAAVTVNYNKLAG
jgi:hypothetical protein